MSAPDPKAVEAAIALVARERAAYPVEDDSEGCAAADILVAAARAYLRASPAPQAGVPTDGRCKECSAARGLHYAECSLATPSADAGVRQALEAENAKLREAVEFYADPTLYHGIAILADRPTGGFDEDVSMTEEYDYPKPGKYAREVLAALSPAAQQPTETK